MQNSVVARVEATGGGEPSPLVGHRYLLEEVLGRGGTGTVYRAQDRLGGAIALKQLHHSLDELAHEVSQHTQTTSQAVALDLANEFQALTSLRHPHVIHVLDYGFDGQQRPFLTMELLAGARTLVEAGRDQPRAVQLDLLAQLLQALAYMHRLGFIHRDLKPANVLVRDGQVKVLDFGLAIMRERGEQHGAAGTPGYVAPELFRGAPATEASDLYSVGVMAHRMMAAKAPPEPRLAALLQRLIAAEPAQRYQRAEQVLGELRELAGQQLQLETTATRESYLRAARFVGREQERERLEGSLRGAFSGQGEAWLVGGESGVGKSRLVEEVRTLALVRGAVVLRGQGISDGSSPYEDWRPVLRWLVLLTRVSDFEAGVLKPLVPDIEALLQRPVADVPEIQADMAQERLLGVMEALLERLAQPALLILEDQHWASAESLRLLARLSARARTLPLLVVATYRDDERPALPQQLPAMQVLPLSRLGPREIQQLSESMIGAAGRVPQVLELLRRETEGNPFFLVEVVRALAEEAGQLERIGTVPLPEQVFVGGVRQIIQRRLDRVPVWARELLRLAAVVGRHLDPEVLRAAAPEVELPRWLAECAGAAVLDFADGRWRFAHDKLREQLLAGLSPELRPALHRQAAQALEAAHPNAPDWLAALAHHWGEAKDLEREAHYATRAGEQAMSVYACNAAVPYLQRALALASARPLEGTGAGGHLGHLKGLLAEAYYLIGDLQSCLTHGEQALEHLGWPMPRSPLGWRLGLPYQVLARMLQAAAPHVFEEESPERRQRRIEAGRLLIRLCEVFFYLQDANRLLWSGVRLINVLEPVGPSQELARGYIVMATVMGSIPALRSLVEAWCARALEMAERSGNVASLIYVLVRCGVCGVGYARWKDVRTWAERARQLADGARDLRQCEESHCVLSLASLYQGHFRQGIEHANALEASAQRRGAVQTQYWGPMTRSGSMVRLGRAPEVARELEVALPWFEAKAGASETVNIHGGLALSLLRQGQEERALEVAAKGLALLRGMKPVAYWIFGGAAQVAEVYLTVWERRGGGGAPGEALVREAREACKAMRLFGRAFSFGEPFALLCDGLEAHLSGRREAAERAWRQCAARAAQLGMPYEEARAWLELGRHQSPEQPERRELLLRARALFSQLEAADELARTEAELARHASP